MAQRLRFLLDTNVLIPLQDSHQVLETNLANFVRLANVGGHQLLYHPATVADFVRDANDRRKARNLQRIAQYPALDNAAPCPWNTSATSANDACDNEILYALVAARPAGAPQTLEVIPRYLTAPLQLAEGAGIQDVFRTLAGHAGRTTTVAEEVAAAYAQGHKVLVLTERTEHLDAIAAAVLAMSAGRALTLFTLHGRLSKKQRATLIGELNALPPDAPRVLLATGKLVGEGFDHPPLDTLVLAMPISWKGTLQQYAGRPHREHADKTRVRIIDFVDTGHPALRRMWDKRQCGYQAMGYRVPAAPVSDNLDFGAVAPDEVAVAKPQ